MNPKLTNWSTPKIGLAVLVWLIFSLNNLLGAFVVLYAGNRSPWPALLFYFALGFVLVLWRRLDDPSGKAGLGFDHDYFILAAWPLTFPYSIFRARGFWAGLRVMLVFWGVTLLSLIPPVLLIVILPIVDSLGR